MSSLLLGIAVFIALLIILSLYRVIAGPTLFDRVIAAGLIGTKGAILLTLIGFIYGRIEMFIDLALTYALLNFIGAIALGKYFELREGEP
jgi:multicomponent Na+:H+ antiporter subunit F